MVGPPELRFAMNGPWKLAYQILGDGPDLMYLPGWVPWQWSDEDLEDIEAAFGGPALTDVAESYIRTALPTYAGDPAAIRRMAMLLALTASPSSGVAESQMTRQINLRDLLPTITVPTLVLHRTDDPVEPVQSSRYLAEHIPGATLVELPGRDTLPWVVVAGSGLELEDAGEHELKGVPDRWRLYRVIG